MTCAHCDCGDTKKHGRDRDGHQRFRCRDCGRTFSDKPPAALGRMNVDPDKAEFALRMILEGTSLRATARLTGLDRNTLGDLILTAGESCRGFLRATVRNVTTSEVQADELWSFVAAKQRTCERLGFGPERGDAYLFLGIDRASKLILAWHLGKRSLLDAHEFAGNLRQAVAGRPTIHTDGFRPYRVVIRHVFGDKVDHAVLVKKYGHAPDDGGPRRYSPAQIIGIGREKVCGDPDLAAVAIHTPLAPCGGSR